MEQNNVSNSSISSISSISYIYKNFSDYHSEIEEFKHNIKNPNYMNGEYDTLYDLPFKYINILKHLETLLSSDATKPRIQIKNLVDPGCAYSSLSAYISKKYNADNAYLFDFDNVSGKNILLEQQKIFNMNNINTKLHFYGGDYYSNVSNIPDNSIDLVIDGCSITHFCDNKGGNQSWNAFCKTIYPKLTSNGYIVIATDVKDYQENDETNELRNLGSLKTSSLLNTPVLGNTLLTNTSGLGNTLLTNTSGLGNTIETITGAKEEFLYPLDIINIFKNNGFSLVGNPVLSNDKIILSNLYPLRVISMVFIKLAN